MNKLELATFSTGAISVTDRVVRIGLGAAVLFGALHVSIVGDEAYPMIKMAAAILVLTGIAGWDPLYAAFRSAVKGFKSIDREVRPVKSAL